MRGKIRVHLTYGICHSTSMLKKTTVKNLVAAVTQQKNQSSVKNPLGSQEFVEFSPMKISL